MATKNASKAKREPYAGECLAPRQKKRGSNWNLMLLAIPGLIFLIAFYYLPLFGLVLPFKRLDYSKGILNSPSVGFKNFEFFFKSQDAWRVTRNTLALNFLFISVTLILAIILALLLFELPKNRVKVYQTCMFVPYFISWIVASYVLYALLNPQTGMVPHLLKEAGKTVPNFYNERKYWPFFLIASYVWKNVGYMTLLFYTSLMGMDSGYIEAAAIDGAGKFKIALHISLPYLKPVIILMALLQIGKIFYADFGMFYFLTRDSGTLYAVTDVIDTYVYRALRVTGDVGMSAAVGLYQSIVGFILVLTSNLVVRKIDKDSAIF